MNLTVLTFIYLPGPHIPTRSSQAFQFLICLPAIHLLLLSRGTTPLTVWPTVLMPPIRPWVSVCHVYACMQEKVNTAALAKRHSCVHG